MPRLAQGQVYETTGRTVTETDIVAFCGLSGDFTRLHIDEEFARSLPHGTRIAHGPLVSAIAIGLATWTGIFGDRVIGALSTSWSYLAPVKAGDTLKAWITIAELRPTSKPGRQLAAYDFSVKNQHGAEVQTGRLTVILRAED